MKTSAKYQEIVIDIMDIIIADTFYQNVAFESNKDRIIQ